MVSVHEPEYSGVEVQSQRRREPSDGSEICQGYNERGWEMLKIPPWDSQRPSASQDMRLWLCQSLPVLKVHKATFDHSLEALGVWS